jgi:trigger factor
MELPQPMVDTQAREMVENYARRLQSQGLNINDYMKYTGMTPEKLMEQMRPEAEKRIKTRLVLEKVVEVENVEVSDEKLDEQINEIAASYKLEGAKLKEMMGEREKEQIREDLKVQAAIDLLVEQAKLA